jgi:hypothetical protein
MEWYKASERFDFTNSGPGYAKQMCEEELESHENIDS